MRRVFFLSTLLVLAWGAAVQAAPPPDAAVRDRPHDLPPLDAIVTQFAAVAFGHEHGASRQVVQKWQSAPSLYFVARSPQDLEAELPGIRHTAAEIRALTAMSWQVASGRDTASLTFGFMRRGEIAALPAMQEISAEQRRFLTESACVAIAAGDEGQPGRIARAAIVIGTDITEALRRHCVVEEMVQVMGLPNDACHYRPSLFCEDDRLLQMAAADRILLKTLYDPQLTAGMPMDAALPVARALIGTLIAGIGEAPQGQGALAQAIRQ